MLGKGAFGKVNLGLHKITRKLVAVKSMNKNFLAEDQ
jgi:serine/threonine protein kinase